MLIKINKKTNIFLVYFFKTTFKQRQLLDAEKIKQGLPNAQQARLLAADQGFAAQAGAIAGQQDAATRFAGLGMQRGFGQLSWVKI